MSHGLPCPNPTCSHLFAPDAVRGATALSCPLCGTVYQFRKKQQPSSAAPAPAPARAAGGKRPSAPPPPPPPPPAPRQRTAPVAAAPVAQPVVPDVSWSALPTGSGTLVEAPTRRRRHHGGGWGKFLFGLCVFLLLAGGAGTAIYLFWPSFEKAAAASRPPEGWSVDDALKQRVRASLAMSREGPRGHVALIIRDYATRNASEAELVKEAKAFLETHFRMMQYQDPSSAPRKPDADRPTMADLPATVFPFEGVEQNIPMRGQVSVVSHQGYAYWMFAWAPQVSEEQLRDDWDALRAWLPLRPDREGWRPTPRESELVLGGDLPYQVRFVKEVWQRGALTRDDPSKAEAYYHGFEVSVDEQGRRSRDFNTGRMATVRVFGLAATENTEAAVNAALAHLRKLAKLEDEKAAVEVLADEKGRAGGNKLGELPGRVLRLRVATDDRAYQRYGVLGVARLGEGTLAIYCECRWLTRDYWDAEFQDVLATVKAQKEKEKGKAR